MENFRTMNCTGCQCNGCYECSSANCDICYRAEFANEHDKDMYHTVTNKKECDFSKDRDEITTAYKNDLIRIAEENWTDSQVKMLKGLICAAVNGIEYSDAYEAVNRE